LKRPAIFLFGETGNNKTQKEDTMEQTNFTLDENDMPTSMAFWLNTE